jgi:hypothetical protein
MRERVSVARTFAARLATVAVGGSRGRVISLLSLGSLNSRRLPVGGGAGEGVGKMLRRRDDDFSGVRMGSVEDPARGGDKGSNKNEVAS